MWAVDNSSELVTPAMVLSVHLFHITECHHRCFVYPSLFGTENTWMSRMSLIHSWPLSQRMAETGSSSTSWVPLSSVSMLMTNLISFLFLILEMTGFCHRSFQLNPLWTSFSLPHSMNRKASSAYSDMTKSYKRIHMQNSSNSIRWSERACRSQSLLVDFHKLTSCSD